MTPVRLRFGSGVPLAMEPGGVAGGCGGSASAVAGPLVFSAGVVSGTSGLSSVRLGLVEGYPKLVRHDEARANRSGGGT